MQIKGMIHSQFSYELIFKWFNKSVLKLIWKIQKIKKNDYDLVNISKSTIISNAKNIQQQKQEHISEIEWKK
jgi:hypothetical protein